MEPVSFGRLLQAGDDTTLPGKIDSRSKAHCRTACVGGIGPMPRQCWSNSGGCSTTPAINTAADLTSVCSAKI